MAEYKEACSWSALHVAVTTTLFHRQQELVRWRFYILAVVVPTD